MTAKLTKVELDITREIINIGFSKAADSLSSFINDKVLIQHLELKINSSHYNPLSRKKYTDKTYLLTTNIRGDISGKAYLIFNEAEVELLAETNLPESLKNDPTGRKTMTDAILLEIDNIITASVITQFANILQYKLYGDVPDLKILSQNELNPFLGSNNPDQCNVMYFNTRFITGSMDINPEFIWLMDDKFFEGVKNIVTEKNMEELVQKLSVNE